MLQFRTRLAALYAAMIVVAIAPLPASAGEITPVRGFANPSLTFSAATPVSDDFNDGALAPLWAPSLDASGGGGGVEEGGGALTLATALVPAGSGATSVVGVFSGVLPSPGSYTLVVRGRFVDTGGV